MSLIIAGIVLFVTAAVIANIIQSVFKYSYEVKPLLFVTLFVICLGVVSMYENSVFSLVLSVPIFIIALIYALLIIVLVNHWKPMHYLYGLDTVQAGYEGLARPKPQGQIVKVFEVMLQDVSAWLIIGGLFLLKLSFFEVVAIFTIIVALLHVPGVWVFGRVYGWYFLIMSTALAFLVPFFYTLGPYGFKYLYMLHLGAYIFMYIIMGLLGRRLAST